MYAAHHAGKAVTPLQKDFNDVISNGELETKLRVISSQLANPLDQAIFSDRVNDLKVITEMVIQLDLWHMVTTLAK